VAAALWAAVAFVGIAGQFVLLSAYFLAVVEVLVYAGAIMVLFLFVIMLLNLRDEDLKSLAVGPRLHWTGGLFAIAFLAALVWTCRRAGLFEEPVRTGGPAGETAGLAQPLFAHYALPFEIASFLLLAAIVGAVLVTKRRLG
jgi:NADH-quinone oxidoreductase subunit J